MASLPQLLPVVLGLGLLASTAAVRPALAQQQGYGQTMTGVTGTDNGAGSMGSGMGKSNSVLDAVNPIDLMNKIRRNQALDDATPPGDAIDQALKDYQSQPLAAPGSAGPSATVKAP